MNLSYTPYRNDTGEEDAPFNHGRWSDASCNKNNGLSNLSFTVCECYSFGVFAVVLNQADKVYNYFNRFRLGVQTIAFEEGIPSSFPYYATGEILYEPLTLPVYNFGFHVTVYFRSDVYFIITVFISLLTFTCMHVLFFYDVLASFRQSLCTLIYRGHS